MLMEGMDFHIFLKVVKRYLGGTWALNGMSMQVGGDRRRHLQGEEKFTN